MWAPFFPIEAEKKGVSSATVGLIFSAYIGVLFVGVFVMGSVVRHFGLRFMIGAGTFLAGGSVLLFGFMDKVPAGDAYVPLCFLIRIVQGVGTCT